MTRTQIVEITCDLCGWGGPWARESEFRSVPAAGGRTVDLCQWCASTRRAAWMECGAHRVRFLGEGDDRTWICSCGSTHTGARFRLVILRAVPAWVLEAVPDLVNATASMHTNGRTP